MLILAVDTTLAACSAAIYDSGATAVLAHLHEPMRQGHAERLAGMMREVAAKAGIGFHQLDRIAVTTGPGTFTGVRIGLAMVRGIGRALDTPVVGISTLQAIAANVEDNLGELPITAIMDARRNAVFTQTFSHQCEPLSEPECIALPDVVDHLPVDARIVVGSGVELVGEAPPHWLQSAASILPNACVVARLSQGLAINGPPPVPLYLRPVDAKPQTALIKLAPLAVAAMPADAAHAPVLAIIHGECFAKGWNDQDLSQMLASPGMSALIAMSEEGASEPTGFILMRQAADEAEIITLCVRPHLRRRGVAAQLLGAAVKQVKSGGAAKVFLEVRADNVAAKSLYTSFGFADAGLRSDYYTLEDGSRADAVIMSQEF